MCVGGGGWVGGVEGMQSPEQIGILCFCKGHMMNVGVSEKNMPENPTAVWLTLTLNRTNWGG